jgi:hypothetical protein
MMLYETVKWCGYRTHTKTFFIGEFDKKRDGLQKIPSKVPSFAKVSPFPPTPHSPAQSAPPSAGVNKSLSESGPTSKPG